MTDEAKELTARLLTRFCGWRWVRGRSEKRHSLLWPPWNDTDGEWQPSPCYSTPEEESKNVETLTEVPPVVERYSDWHRTCCRQLPGRMERFEHGMPNLTESLDACAMLKAAIIARGLQVSVHCYGSEDGSLWIQAKIIDDENDDVTIGYYSNNVPIYSTAAEARAICMAADAIPAEVKT